MSDTLDGLALTDYSVSETKLANAFTTKVTNAYTAANLAYAKANSAVAPGTNVTGNITFTTGRLGLGTSPNTTLHVQGASTLESVIEKINVSATPLTANLNFDVLTQPILYLTSSATANATINFRGNSTIALDGLLRIGQTITASLLVTNGSTPYKANVVLVDNIVQAVKWAGALEPVSGNPFCVDLYSYTIIKTGNSAFTVLASQQKYA
jgi:hypothetical protein